MHRHLKSLIWLVVISTLVVACGTTREVSKEDKTRRDFKVLLAERQVARRRETAKECRRQGVDLPDKYEQKGGGMLEEYVDGYAPCGVSAQDRMRRAETDFRATWKVVVAKPVPPEYEWLLAVKSRIAAWLDVGGLTPEEARMVLREAQWVLVGWDDSGNPGTGPDRGSSGGATHYFASLDTALNQALASDGIACRKGGEKKTCF